MTAPFYDHGILMGLFAGFLFGFVLEGAGFGSPRKLTGQFTLRDFSVFKVMFVAVIVAAALLWIADAAGAMPAERIYVPTLFFWAIAAGGALIGAGFAIGGYCPGTSAVGFASGRLDALVFMAGMVAGTGLFAGLFDDMRPFYFAAQGPKRETLEQLLGVPAPVVIGALAVIAAVGYRVGSMLERRFGGPVTAEDVAGAGDARTTGQGEAGRRA